MGTNFNTPHFPIPAAPRAPFSFRINPCKQSQTIANNRKLSAAVPRSLLIDTRPVRSHHARPFPVL